MESLVIRITYSSSFEWYNIGDQFNVIYDPYIGWYVTEGGRCINPDHCEIYS